MQSCYESCRTGMSLLVVSFLPLIKSLFLVSSVTHALMSYEWIISSFHDDLSP